MLLAAILASIQGDQSDFEQLVSIEARGITGKDLVAQLSSQTGIRFETLDEATRDHYIVHITKAPLRVALQRIAEAENGEWEPRGPREFRLRRSPAKIAQLRQARHDDVVKRFIKALSKYREKLSERADFSDETAKKLAHDWKKLGPPPNGGIDTTGYWSRQNNLEQAIPVGRAFMRVLTGFSPEDLASIPIQRKVVYSTNPTAMQRRLPDSAFQALNQLVSEQIVWEDAVAKYLPDQVNQGWNGMATGGHIRNVTNAMISMSRWDDSGGVQAQLMLSDKKGHIVTETYMFIDAGYEPPQPNANGKPKEPEPEIPVSDTDRVLANIYSFNSWDARNRKVEATTAALGILSQPEKIDPLGTFIYDTLSALADRRKENLAAVIDERLLYTFSFAINKKGISPAALDFKNRGFNVDEGNGWLVLGTQDPDRADEVRCDRHALQVMLDAARAKGRLTLDDAAAYAATSERFNENQIPMAYLAAFLDRQGPKTLQENDKNLLRLYGSLDPDSRANIPHLNFGNMSAMQIDCIDKLVFGMNSMLQDSETEPMSADEDGQYYGMWNTIAREATVTLGNGIPRNGYMTVKSDKGNVILAHMQYGDWDQGQQAYEPQSLAWMIASKETQQNQNMGWTVLGMSAADRTQVTFEFKFTDKISQTMTLQDVLPTTKETPFVEKLPEALRRELQKAIDDAKKQYAEGNGVQYYGGFGGVNSAPPQ